MAVSNIQVPVPALIKDHPIRMMVLYPSGQDPRNKNTELYLASLFKHEVDAVTDPMVYDIIKDRRFQHIDMGKYFVNYRYSDSKYHLYLCVNADCAFPPHYLVAADSIEEAHDEFLTETDSCLIEESDLKDYDQDSLRYDDNGRPMDTDSLQIRQLSIILISFVDYADMKVQD
jgi:hypothetical protein